MSRMIVRARQAAHDAKHVLYRRYQYEPIPPGEHFRYIVLQPGAGDDPLVCSLVSAPLAETHFEAISYVWGSPKRNKVIWCDKRLIKITSSLHEVMCRLRLPSQPRRLWADGIGINQDDVKEKGHQVGFMGKIYQKATRVLIYLGSDSGEDGEKVGTLLREVRSLIDKELSRLDPLSFDSYPYPNSNDPILIDARWAACQRLIRKEWFERGWVLREAGLAQSGLIIWGQTQYNWGDLMMLFSWVAYRANDVALNPLLDTAYIEQHLTTYRDRHNASVRVFRGTYQLQPRSLLEYLSYDLSFSDPRDRIYAFLDLTMEPLSELVLRPDYDKSLDEVYLGFAKQYLRATGDTRLLDRIVQSVEAPQSSLPSWVPRWDLLAADGAAYNGYERAALSPRQGTFPLPDIVDKTTLKVPGVIFDSIQYLSEVFHEPITAHGDIFDLAKCVRDRADPSPYPAHLLMDAFFAALTRNRCIGDWETWCANASIYIRRLAEHTEHLSSFTWDADDQHARELTLMQARMSLLHTEARFMITKRGYMGLAPPVAREGDLCSIVFGCDTPSILRRTDRESQFQILGRGFVLGSWFAVREGFDGGGSAQSGTGESASEDVQSGSKSVELGGAQDGGDGRYYTGLFSIFGEAAHEEWDEWAEEQDIYLV